MEMNAQAFDLFADNFCNNLERLRGLSSFTVRGYRADLKSVGEFMVTEEISSVGEFDRQDVRRYLSWLLELGYQRSSIVRKLSVLRRFFGWMLDEGYLKINPVPRRLPMKKDRILPRFLSKEEISRMIVATTEVSGKSWISLRDAALLELMYGAGLRVSEVSSSDLSGLDLVTNQIKVEGKGSKERISLFGLPAARALKLYLENARLYLLNEKNTDALFVSRDGNRLSVRSIQDRVVKYARASGLGQRVHAHTLRHSFATHMIDGGADLRVVQELLGHSTPETTQIYTHVTGSQARKTYILAHPMSDIDSETNPKAN